MERFTFMSDGYNAVGNSNCYDDQNEDYCGPAIDRLADYEETGMLPDELKAKLERLDILEKAIDRLGKFGRLFRDYKGCPRGQRGESGYVPGIPHKHILLREDPITDVEGDVWIPVLARDLYRYIDKHRWIPVTERLPDLILCDAGTAYSEAVNVLTEGRKVLTAVWNGKWFICDEEFWEAWGEKITHWTPVLLPLPESPKEES